MDCSEMWQTTQGEDGGIVEPLPLGTCIFYTRKQRALRAPFARLQYICYSLYMNTITQAGLENGCVASGNGGQRRSGGQGRRELQNKETRYRTRAKERQLAGVIEEM